MPRLWDLKLLEGQELFSVGLPRESENGNPQDTRALHGDRTGRDRRVLPAVPLAAGVDKVQPTATDLVGVAVSLIGMGIIMFGHRAG